MFRTLEKYLFYTFLFLASIWLFIRKGGWIIITALFILVGIIYGFYALTVAPLTIKLSIYLCSFLVIKFIIVLFKSDKGELFPTPEDKIKNLSLIGWFKIILAIIAVILAFVNVYIIIISLFVLPWYVSVCFGIELLATVISNILSKCGIKSPAYLITIIIALNWIVFVLLAYQLANLLNWI